MLLYILIALVVLAAVALAASLRFGFRYDNAEKSANFSYLFFRTIIDFQAMQGTIRLAGIRVTGFDLIPEKKPEKVKPVPKEKPSPKRKRGMPKVGWDDFRMLVSFLKKFHIKYLAFTISGGFSDPYETGKYFGIYSALSGAAPGVMKHVAFYPDFASSGLHFEGKGLIYIRLFHIVYFAVKIVVKKRKWILGEPLIVKKKGASYAQ